jgi:hypothetical protein
MFEPKRQLLVEPGGLVMTGFGALPPLAAGLKPSWSVRSLG